MVRGDLIGQKLERHEPMEFHILRFIDHAHTTIAELLYDAIMRNGLAD